MKGLKNAQTRGLARLKAPNLIIISADSKIDSYELIDACEKVIVFGSGMGIESAFWGKPSILIGRAVYEDLGGCYVPKNHNEVVNLINRRLNPAPNRSALKYGYWQSVDGLPYIYYRPESVRGGKFMGVYLKSPVVDRLKDKILAADQPSRLIVNLAYSIRKWTWKIRRTR